MAKKPSRPVGPVRARATVKQPAKKATRMAMQNTLGGLVQAGYGSKNYAPRRMVGMPDPMNLVGRASGGAHVRKYGEMHPLMLADRMMMMMQKRRSSKKVK